MSSSKLRYYDYFVTKIKTFLIFTASAAWCSSTNYYGWTPNKELIFRFESQVLTGIPEIRDSQFAGLRLASDVRVQAFSDFSLRIKFENSTLINLNGDVDLSGSGELRQRDADSDVSSIPDEMVSISTLFMATVPKN